MLIWRILRSCLLCCADCGCWWLVIRGMLGVGALFVEAVWGVAGVGALVVGAV